MEEDGAAATTEKSKVEVVPRHVFAPKIQRVARGPCRLNMWEWLILTPSRPMHMIRVVQKPTCMNEASQNAEFRRRRDAHDLLGRGRGNLLGEWG